MTATRTYDPDGDRPGVRGCIVELQEYERALEPHLPLGEQMADDYLDFLLRQCEEREGQIIVAVEGSDVAGFTCVLTRVEVAPDEGESDAAYVSDLVVRERYRRHGIGRALMREAESVARRAGLSEVCLNVLVRNSAARAFYLDLGFGEYTLQLTKPIAAA